MKTKLHVLFFNFIMANLITAFAILMGALCVLIIQMFAIIIQEMWGPVFAFGLYGFVILVCTITLIMYWKNPMKFGKNEDDE